MYNRKQNPKISSYIKHISKTCNGDKKFTEIPQNKNKNINVCAQTYTLYCKSIH